MVARVLRPEGKGFIFLDSHPAGCARTVAVDVAWPDPPLASAESAQW